MAGFDNGTIWGGVTFQAKQFGSILRGFGPPVPQAGVVGDVYIDVQTWQLFEKRASDQTDPWGHYLFVVPAPYRTQLKWFTSSIPDNSIGIAGDFCLLWGGFANYGLQPSIFGPKQAGGFWPENGNGGTVPIAIAGAGTVLPVGLEDEGAPLAASTSTQLIVVGLLDEFILAVPVTANAGDPVTQQGLQSGPAQISVLLNSLYTAEDENNVGFSNIVPGEQNNVSIAAVTGLTVPAAATYAVVTAVGGILYATYDGTVPSPTNFAISLVAGQSLPVTGAGTLSAIKVIGTSMSVSYWN